MINIIDKVRYLIEDKKKLLDSAKVMNDLFRSKLKKVKNQVKEIDDQGHDITVTFTGKPGETEINISSQDEVPEQLQEQIRSRISKAIRGK